MFSEPQDPGFIMYKSAYKTIHLSVAQRKQRAYNKANIMWIKAYLECLKEKRHVSIIKKEELERLLW